MEIKQTPHVFHVEPVRYSNVYNRQNFNSPMKELIRFNNKHKSTFHKWDTTETYDSKPFADGFIKYSC